MNAKNPASGRGHRIALATSLLFSLLIILWLISRLHWADVVHQMAQMNGWYLPLLMASFPLLVWIRALRWRLLLPNQDNLSTRNLADATFIGFFASTVLPLRAGEIIRPWVASRWQPVSFSTALVSIVIERLADAVCLLTLFALCLARISEMPAAVLAGAKALGVMTISILLGIFASYCFPERMERILHAVTARATRRFGQGLRDRINRMITDAFAGLRVIASFRQLLVIMLFSYVIWIGAAAWYLCLLWAFGVYPSFWVGMLLNVIIALAVAAPSAPGFIGTFQVGCLIALSTVSGYPEEFAMAYSVVGHGIQMAITIACGFIVLQIRNLTLRQIRAIPQSGSAG